MTQAPRDALTRFVFEHAAVRGAHVSLADTTAAVCGQLAGAFFGRDGIPVHWRERVFMGDEIAQLGGDLFDLGTTI